MHRCTTKGNYYSKKPTQGITPKYIPPHHRKSDEIKVPEKEARKTTKPLAIKTRKSQHKTLKLQGMVKNKNLTILVDYGSTHNCIDINVVK